MHGKEWFFWLLSFSWTVKRLEGRVKDATSQDVDYVFNQAFRLGNCNGASVRPIYRTYRLPFCFDLHRCLRSEFFILGYTVNDGSVESSPILIICVRFCLRKWLLFCATKDRAKSCASPKLTLVENKHFGRQAQNNTSTLIDSEIIESGASKVFEVNASDQSWFSHMD